MNYSNYNQSSAFISLRFTIILTSLSFLLTFLLIGLSGRITPYLQIGVGISTLIVILIASLDSINQIRFYCYLSIILATGILFQGAILVLTPGIIGIDPNLYAILIQAVRDSGTIDPITIPFYESAPNYIVAMAIFGETLGIPTEKIRFVIPILVGGGLALFGVLITRTVVSDYISLLVVCAIIVNSPILAQFAFKPIAQSYAMVLFIVCIYILALASQPGEGLENRNVVIFLTTSICLIFTHKFPIIILLILLFVLVFITKLGDLQSFSTLGRLLATVSMVLFWLWVFQTGFASEVLFSLATILTASGEITMTSYAAASVTEPNMWEQINQKVNWLVLGVLGGVGWILVGYREWKDVGALHVNEKIVLLATSSILMLMLALSAVGAPSEINSARILAISIPFLTGFVAINIRYILHHQYRGRKSLAIFIIVIILIAQVAAVWGPGVYPDQEPRDYTTPAEYDAKDFMFTYTQDETIHTDYYYVRAGNNIRNPPVGYWSYGKGKYQAGSWILFTRPSSNIPADWIAHRTTIKIYRHRGVERTLDYNPTPWLSSCGHRVYQTAGVNLYQPSRC